MKKILIIMILFVILFVGCSTKKIPDKFFVRYVSYSIDNTNYIYLVELQSYEKFNGDWVILHLYTNTEYSVGDKVYLTKKEK